MSTCGHEKSWLGQQAFSMEKAMSQQLPGLVALEPSIIHLPAKLHRSKLSRLNDLLRQLASVGSEVPIQQVPNQITALIMYGQSIVMNLFKQCLPCFGLGWDIQNGIISLSLLPECIQQCEEPPNMGRAENSNPVADVIAVAKRKTHINGDIKPPRELKNAWADHLFEVR